MKNYYQWLSINPELSTKEIQTLIIQKLQTVNQQQALEEISDIIYIETITQLRQAQEVFKDELSRQQYDAELVQLNQKRTAKISDVRVKIKSKMEQQHDKIVSKYRLWQKLLIIIGIIITFIISMVTVGIKASFIFLAIASVSLLLVMVLIPVFRKLQLDQRPQFFKFGAMFVIFIIWYYSLQFLLNAVQLSVIELEQIGNILIYCLLGCLITGLVLEWFIFQEEIKFEDSLRERLEKQNMKMDSKEDTV
ncbi:hypothetical protein [Globicatella sanguinis]|uniref:hypothetical protein n=1 Tax=Globicatella sanguinis TaxID=13076 RepID=UPI002542C694|nr:hypothetical protein [Globicatella sanguinis]MDK7631494.1 hypothetical protein [Globicatella sanguinis]WIK67076.1 hypothetical protein CYJ72_003005 [Globicatella sanguinis]WKT56481.1 hypothetical protein Q3C38_03005 [Globicatella sanguinis]